MDKYSIKYRLCVLHTTVTIVSFQLPLDNDKQAC